MTIYKPNDDTPSSDQPTYGTLVVRLENALKSIEFQRRELFHLRDELAESQACEEKLRAAHGALLTHFGMDEDEWTKPTFDQAREALTKRLGCDKGCEPAWWF
jgi:hypothetical protein